jgi:hypothetical protein
MTKRKRGVRRRREVGRSLVHNPDSPIGKPIGTERAREMARLVKRPGHGGRRPDPNRCPCGKFTQERARKRNHKCVRQEVAQ